MLPLCPTEPSRVTAAKFLHATLPARTSTWTACLLPTQPSTQAAAAFSKGGSDLMEHILMCSLVLMSHGNFVCLPGGRTEGYQGYLVVSCSPWSLLYQFIHPLIMTATLDGWVFLAISPMSGAGWLSSFLHSTINATHECCRPLWTRDIQTPGDTTWLHSSLYLYEWWEIGGRAGWGPDV